MKKKFFLSIFGIFISTNCFCRLYLVEVSTPGGCIVEVWNDNGTAYGGDDFRHGRSLNLSCNILFINAIDNEGWAMVKVERRSVLAQEILRYDPDSDLDRMDLKISRNTNFLIQIGPSEPVGSEYRN